ncbi:MAG TPA: metallophosphoesterase family protein [Aquella sp.]|nr:metallophosphoesterase family protein [Aquella sp.]
MITYNNKEYPKALIYGDTHGCVEQVMELLAQAKLDNQIIPGRDLILSTGDLVDRGPDSTLNIRLCMNLGIQPVKGNHDDKWVRWRRNTQRELKDNNYKNKMRPLGPRDLEEFAKLTDEDHEWLAALPEFIEFKTLNQEYIVVHAGFLPGIPWRRQVFNTMCRLRYVDQDTKQMIPYRKDNDPPSNGKYWTEFWQGPEKVIYGHQVHDLNHVRVSNNNLCYGIDTGCCYAGNLTAMIIDASNPYQDKISYQQVKSSRAYAELWSHE